MRHKFDSIFSEPESNRRGNEIVKDMTKSKGLNSRGAFKVGITYNSILDDRENEEELSEGDSGVSFFTAKDSGIDATAASLDNTQPSSFLCDNDEIETSSTLGYRQKKRRVVKKKSAQEGCLGIDVLPDSFQTAFSFRQFNRMQTEAFPIIYKGEENCVISSPTGSGKTVLFELAIMRLIKDMNGATENVKILYIAPTKSLCCEKFKNWSPKFLGLSVGMLTSDTSFLETQKIKKCNIIITTPEKWDLLTRKWKDYGRLFELIKLILVDEVHILRERRGATLEVVLTRMNIFCDKIRIIAVSATIPNVEDIAQWLGSRCHGKYAEVLAFDDTYRQVTLEKHVYGYSFHGTNEFQHDSLYNLKLDEILVKHSKERAVMIFCPTRASTVSTAKYIAKHCPSSIAGQRRNQSYRVDDQNLACLVNQGIAFHHAGLSMADREFVEQGFLNGVIKVLCSTSTLAVGVNLPAYLVVIKGTKMWNTSGTQEYTQLDILQMIGRAGRPQFEKNGCAVILTESKMKDSYEKLLLGTDELESALHLELIEHLAAEISLGTIFSIQTAVSWLRKTYFYVRSKKKPSAYYQFNMAVRDNLDQDSQITHFVQHLLDRLLEFEIIERQNDKLICTPYGNAMARHYVLFDSMKLFLGAHNSQGPDEILNFLANAKEFADIRIRQKEKRLYKEINGSPLLRFPYLTDGKQSRIIGSPSQKISLLIQYELGGLEYPSYNGAFALHQTMVQDKLLVFRHCYRLLKCMVDIFVEREDGTSLKNALFLLRSVSGVCWEDSVMVLRQLKSIGLISVRKLVQRGVRCLQDMRKLSDQQIESYLSLKVGNGSKIKRDVNSLPQLEMECTLEHLKAQKSHVIATFKVQISAIFTSSVWHGQHLSVDVEVSKASGELLDFRRISLAYLASPRVFTVVADIKSSTDNVEFSMNCLEVAGLGERTKFFAADLLSNYPESLVVPAVKGNVQCLRQPEDMESSPSSDDSILEYLSTQRDEAHKMAVKNESDTSEHRKIRSNGNCECYHSCKDKTRCRHLCCKEGIPGNCLRGKNGVTNSQSIASVSCERKDSVNPTANTSLLPGSSIIVESKRCRVPPDLLRQVAGDRESWSELEAVNARNDDDLPSVCLPYNAGRPASAASSSSATTSNTATSEKAEELNSSA
ncbi:hypothetical protein HG536_0D06080 [Torulaspora globosa]|uniref:DNA 3'-5' helicase n=1 Tax=Torulaspora globosa TaxID=48254 RepID=A0A7G3ZHU9_9SACH|nr:uncharacterized protein HG536_0D06080 [Torulaspora globosa]QLL33085.1 hypothetical protein HG536_0D06080 [Torulaspora globosa]